MTIELVTGVPGAGKTLYTLAKKVRPLVGKTISITDEFSGEARDFDRRLMVCGIRDLLLPHEIVDVAVSHDPWESMTRLPGEKPHDVPHVVQNWWLWCQPGDVIVIDECQRVFRPSAAGQKIPAFIRHLETHRHYGVDLILVTQHPQLIHANVRNLIGHHEHVRRIFGGAGTIVYEWDHCTHPDRTKQAAGRLWSHDKSAFGLYKSAQVHTKVKHKIPGAVMLAVAGFVALPVAGYQVYGRMSNRFSDEPLAASLAPLASASAPLPESVESLPHPVASLPVALASSSVPVGVAGCISTATRCRCIDAGGEWITTDLEQCRWNSENIGQWVKYDVAVITRASRSASSLPAPVQSPAMPGDPASSILTASSLSEVAPVLSAFSDGHISR